MGHDAGCAQQAYAYPDGQRPQLSYVHSEPCLGCSVFWNVHKGSRIIVDEAMTTALRGHRGGRTGRLAGRPGRGLCPGSGLAVGLLVCLVEDLGRRLLNRRAHMSHGNTALIQLVDGEAIYEISGSRSGKTHRVWVDLKPRASAVTQTQQLLRPKQLVCVAPPRRRAAHRPPRRRAPTRCFRGPLFAVAMRSVILLIRARALRVSQQSQEASLTAAASVVFAGATAIPHLPFRTPRRRFLKERP